MSVTAPPPLLELASHFFRFSLAALSAMEKLSQFFAKRKAAGDSSPIDEASFPEFNADEEKEIFESLGVSPAVALKNHAEAAEETPATRARRPSRVRDVVFGTLRSFKQVKVEDNPVDSAAEAGTAPQDVENLGTVRIKLADGRSKWGTLRRNKQNPAEIVMQQFDAAESSSDSDSDSASEANTTADTDSTANSGSGQALSDEADDEEMYSSVRIKDPSVLESLEQDFGTMKINSGGSATAEVHETPLWMQGGQKPEVRYWFFLFRVLRHLLQIRRFVLPRI